MDQPWLLSWFMPLLIVVPVTWFIVRREFQVACVYWGQKSSASLRVAGWTFLAALLILATGYVVFLVSGNWLVAALEATIVLLAFGPVNAWWGLRLLFAAWNFLDNNYGLSFRTIAGLSVGALSGLVLVALTGWELLSLGGLAVVGGSAALGWLWFVRDGVGDLTGN